MHRVKGIPAIIYIYIYTYIYTYICIHIYTHIFIYIYISGYNHNGFVATHALGHMMYIMCPSAWVATKSLWW